MTSKNYLCKGIRDHIHRHMFLTILVSLALLVALPIHCITELDVAKGDGANSGGFFKQCSGSIFRMP